MRAIQIALIVCLCFGLSSCTQVRAVWYFFPDIKDYKKFPVVEIKPSQRPFDFKRNLEGANQLKHFFDQPPYSLKKVLKKTKTNAFLVYHRDTLIYEYYRKGFKPHEVRTVFSISKSMVAMLYLDAIHRGKLESFDIPVSKFIPWLQDPAFEKITLAHLLNMQSGLSIKSKKMADIKEGPANFYYSPEIREAMNRLMIVKHSPGMKFSYEDINVQLLMFAIENIMQKPFLEIFQERLWQPAGTKYPAFWITDRSKEQIPYAYSGLTCTAEDLARVGMVLLNRGYAGDSLFCSQFQIDELLRPGANDPQLNQKWLWWHNVNMVADSDHERAQERIEDIYADGFRGQFIYIYPEKDLMIIRTGKKYEYERILFHNPSKRKFKWQTYFLNAARQFNP